MEKPIRADRRRRLLLRLDEQHTLDSLAKSLNVDILPTSEDRVGNFFDIYGSGGAVGKYYPTGTVYGDDLHVITHELGHAQQQDSLGLLPFLWSGVKEVVKYGNNGYLTPGSLENDARKRGLFLYQLIKRGR